MKNKEKIILDLCGGTGSWSRPYAEAGYYVRIITLPDYDVRTYKPPERVYGILVAPPCTDFSVSGAQYWRAKDADGRTAESLAVVNCCLDIIEAAHPNFWCLENPVGRLPKLIPYRLGPYIIKFHPWEYGDPYTKLTCLWGNFTIPNRKPVKPIKYCKQGSWIQQLGGKSERTKYLRSITPPGFARAFYEANK